MDMRMDMCMDMHTGTCVDIWIEMCTDGVLKFVGVLPEFGDAQIGQVMSKHPDA